MKYNFDEIVDRHQSNSVKWDLCPIEGVIPMWVADMDFKAAPFILDAVRKRIEHGVFGYTHVPERYYQSVIDWFMSRRGWKIEKDWIQPICGIVPAISIAVEALSEPGDNVLFQSPAYNCFFAAVKNNGRTILENKLVVDESGELPTFRIDFEKFEEQCADPRTSLFILCNPHNPSGRMWTEEELRRMGEICLKHGVTVVSDEIHCELEMPGNKFTPFASLSEEFVDNCVTFNSPSKSFNIAGLEIANIITKDPAKREKLHDVIYRFEHRDLNPLGVEALMAAYTKEGAEWLDELKPYLYENFKTLVSMFAAEFPEVKVSKLEGTYLVWIDCKYFTAKGVTTLELQRSLTRTEKVWINNGTMYGDDDYMRINIACPRSVLVEGVNRIITGFRRIAAGR